MMNNRWMLILAILYAVLAVVNATTIVVDVVTRGPMIVLWLAGGMCVFTTIAAGIYGASYAHAQEIGRDA